MVRTPAGIDSRLYAVQQVVVTRSYYTNNQPNYYEDGTGTVPHCTPFLKIQKPYMYDRMLQPDVGLDEHRHKDINSCDETYSLNKTITLVLYDLPDQFYGPYKMQSPFDNQFVCDRSFYFYVPGRIP